MHTPRSSSTLLRAGLEDVESDHWVVFVFDLIGCYSSGRTEEEAVAQSAERVREYFHWLGRKDGNPAVFEDSVQVTVIERILSRPSPADPNRRILAFFEDDRRPLRLWDIDMILRLLAWNRQDLLGLLQAAPPDAWDLPVPGLVWKTPKGLVEHICDTEEWLLSRLGIGRDRNGLPHGMSERLEAVRACTLQAVPDLAEKEMVRESEGECWSPRKLVRRLLWHERDHVRQLESILPKSG
jgi:predicted RNase H-like HicB family nuclease